ncbi:thioredoxin family protein [Flavobacterium litorale]|uniref:Thioredoxin family protein n=1 Tax=Flavobacterium litorale TaxID=2856519 RepID=A0ABX8VF05_9FLAO|nr:thioredoxin fold domain-containing protein [Flavobacterium litorale]QYJ69415.1 thioredoxin family protein [Flavobacterium litorale]
MKKILLMLFVALGTLATQAQEIKWMSLDEALAAQEKEAKPIFMDVYTDWCGPCKILDRGTFRDKNIVDYINANYYAVKFDAEGASEVAYKGNKYSNPNYIINKKGRNSVHDFTRFMKVRAYPTIVFFDDKGNLKYLLEGPRDAIQLMKVLEKFQS